MKNTGLPTKEKELLKAALQAKQAFIEDLASFHFSEEESLLLIEAVDEFEAAYKSSGAAKTAARVKTSRKNSSRKKLKKILGSYIARMRSMPHITSERLVTFGTQPSDKTRTPVNAPETAPLFNLSYGSAWHIIRFWEEGSTRRRRKPEGVIGAEIYVNFGGNREDSDAYVLKEIAVRSPHTFKYEFSDAGKQVHYYLVWLTRRGERSAMSRIESATIAT
jgi:hypothetical protein